uniref:PP1c_bdg domain-containing protein n=2 Tax=Mesocestoides corti TaxID=53468 RepID=A0A5K3EU33_MESCO
MSSEISVNRDRNLESPGPSEIVLRESLPSFLDTITEEEEDRSSSNSEPSETDSMQHHYFSLDRPSSDTDLLEARNLVADLEGCNWYVRLPFPPITSIDQKADKFKTCAPRPRSPRYPFPLSFLTELKECGPRRVRQPSEPIHPASRSFYFYLKKSVSRSLPSVLLHSEPRSSQRNFSASHTCMKNGMRNTINSWAPSPTKTQLRALAEWTPSSPGITTIADGPHIDASSCLIPSLYAIAVDCSANTEEDAERIFQSSLLNGKSDALHGAQQVLTISTTKMKRSPSMEEVCMFLGGNTSVQNNLSSNLDEPQIYDSSAETFPHSTKDSFSTSVSSLSERYVEYPPVKPRPIYDYGTDESFLEIFMTPAVDNMQCGEDDIAGTPPSVDDFKEHSSKQRFKLSPLENLDRSFVWRDSCRKSWKKLLKVTDNSFHFYNEEDFPFIDQEGSYTEAWYITDDQQFPWLDRAQLADFDEETWSCECSSESLPDEKKKVKPANRLIKSPFNKKNRQVNSSAKNTIQRVRESQSGWESRQSCWFSWVRQLCGCVLRTNGIT